MTDREHEPQSKSNRGAPGPAADAGEAAALDARGPDELAAPRLDPTAPARPSAPAQSKFESGPVTFVPGPMPVAAPPMSAATPVAPQARSNSFGAAAFGHAPSPEVAPGGPADADNLDDLDEEPPVRPTIGQMVRRITPAMAVLTIGSVGSALFLLRAMTSHTTPVSVLMSAGVVTALVFLLDTVILTSATWRVSRDGEFGRALALALLGGVSAVICALALAGTLIMILVLNS